MALNCLHYYNNTQMDLHFPIAPVKRLTGRRAVSVNFDPVSVPKRGLVTIAIHFRPPPTCHWTEDAPSSWQTLTGKKLVPIVHLRTLFTYLHMYEYSFKQIAST